MSINVLIIGQTLFQQMYAENSKVNFGNWCRVMNSRAAGELLFCLLSVEAALSLSLAPPLQPPATQVSVRPIEVLGCHLSARRLLQTVKVPRSTFTIMPKVRNKSIRRSKQLKMQGKKSLVHRDVRVHANTATECILDDLLLNVNFLCVRIDKKQ